MIILSKNGYKSLEPFQDGIEIPDFTVISGLNGAGKTQLLAGIASGRILLIRDEDREYFLTPASLKRAKTPSWINPLRPIKHVDHITLAPNESDTVSYNDLRAQRESVLNVFKHYITQKMKNPSVTLQNASADRRATNLIQLIARNTSKEVDDLDEDDFFSHYPLEDSHTKEFYHQNFSSIFKSYHINLEQNQFNEYRSTQKGMDVKYLSDEEFKKIYGDPPWIIVNEIIKEAKLDYHITSPEGIHRDAPYQLMLVNNYNGAQVNFSDLSSGEKVIMSLALSLYNSKFDLEFPKVLLMDEPDSHLHPSMTKQFLDVIQNVFVSDKGMKIIITTHSPSTVALAPEESLFLMNKAQPRITKTTKDKALRILTSGVPTLSITYENRRQVFVESKYDVIFYESFYEKLKGKLIPEISINFISSGVGGQGSCDQVREIVNTLAGYGNRSIYGIIDWDTRNDSNDFIKVLGKYKRYSLENYIFDPILLAAFLLREKFVDRAALGLAEGDRYTDFINFEDEKLQAIVDIIVNQVRARVGNPPDAHLQVAEYVGGRSINLPSWFLRIQGHRLEEIVKELFPQFNRYQGEGGLKKEIVNKVIDDIPEFIPIDILIIMREIQNFQG